MRYDFAVIGDPIEHSKSPFLFNKIWSEHIMNKQFTYCRINVNKDQLEDFLKKTHLIGFNVTAPLKEFIIPYLSKLTPAAEKIKAVNTVVKVGNKWHGHNTDGDGFWDMFSANISGPKKNSDICILGNGGAARAVTYSLNERGYKGVVLCRSKKGNFVWPEILFRSIKKMKASAVIQCTTLGMHPATENRPLCPIWKGEDMPLAIDLIYNPNKTKFLLEMESLGCKTLGGSQMLTFQAKKAWEYWANVLNIPHI